ncbi:MAG: hypothetical protein HMLKMBBP_03315 [Planctomycetes bacterium]|nr:hypothetical protein [Planctomycetota bacterium]
MAARPDDPAPRRALAFALWNAQRPADAIPHFRALSDAAPADDRLALTLSECARLTGDVELAAAAAERRIAADAADRRGWQALWSAYSREKRWKELSVRLSAHATKSGAGALAAHYAGFAAAAAGETDAALAHLARAAELDPANEVARVERARLLLQVRRDRDGASEILRTLLAERPASKAAAELLSFVAMRRSEDGDHAGAAREAAALAAARPDDPVGHANLGLELRWAGKYAESEAAYRRALELNPGDPVIWNDYGLMLLAVRRRAEAIAAFEKGRAADPAWNDNIENLAWWARSEGRYADALPLFREAYLSALRKGIDGSRHRRNMDDARFPLPSVR